MNSLAALSPLGRYNNVATTMNNSNRNFEGVNLNTESSVNLTLDNVNIQAGIQTMTNKKRNHLNSI